MRTLVLTLLVAGVVMMMPLAAFSTVNCEQVRRYLSTGRSAEDVAETMVISIDEVKKCQQAGSGEQKPAPKQAPAPKPAAGEK
ncbi:MAG: hypothetical protein HY699_09955 [Deltaproteobacteria bacterium]|nr:hypothetical protein [Deltaproteobacteria bacterium]